MGNRKRTKATLCRNYDGSGGCITFENRDADCMSIYYVGDDINDADSVNVQSLDQFQFHAHAARSSRLTLVNHGYGEDRARSKSPRPDRISGTCRHRH